MVYILCSRLLLTVQIAGRDVFLRLPPFPKAVTDLSLNYAVDLEGQ
jgi:hypothetical protein